MLRLKHSLYHKKFKWSINVARQSRIYTVTISQRFPTGITKFNIRSVPASFAATPGYWKKSSIYIDKYDNEFICIVCYLYRYVIWYVISATYLSKHYNVYWYYNITVVHMNYCNNASPQMALWNTYICITWACGMKWENIPSATNASNLASWVGKSIRYGTLKLSLGTNSQRNI